jgi:glycosyltransferase involved in cell wall biosynthesis
VTIHDAIAFRYPEGYPWLNNLLHRRYVPATLGRVDAVITDSEYSRRDLQHVLRFPADGIRVVPLGVADRFRPGTPEVKDRVIARYQLAAPFILSVGVQQERKNLGRLVEAFADLRSRLQTHKLVIAGHSIWRSRDVAEQVARLGLQDAVTLLGHVPDDDLPALYSAADAFVFPSLYEGFGLPVLEAMACGTPVVCSDSSSLPEVAGQAACLVDPMNVRAISDGMYRSLNDPDLRARLRVAGVERARTFSWDRTAGLTLDVYRSVVRLEPRLWKQYCEPADRTPL